MQSLATAITDMGNALVSLGNHVSRTTIAHEWDRADRLAFASREADRLAKELRNLSDEARFSAREVQP